MVAMAVDERGVQAMCLADGGPEQSKYTTASQSCSGYKPRTYGAVDDPPNYGEETRPLYIEAEGPDALKATTT